MNDEARGRVTVRAGRPVNSGEQSTTIITNDIQGFDLQVDELDHGHVTMFWKGNHVHSSLTLAEGG